MGYQGFFQGYASVSGQVLQARDLLRLAALGGASRMAVTADDIWVSIEDMVGDLWLPAGSVLADAICTLLEEGALHSGTTTVHSEPLLTITDSGRNLLASLLSRPIGRSGCPLSRTSLRLKIAYLDLLPAPQRQLPLTSAIASCEEALAEQERRTTLCPAQGRFGRMWQDHEIDRLRRDLTSLRALAMPLAASVSSFAASRP